MAPEWQRVANTTIHDYIRNEEVNILRERKFLAMMESKGRITFNHSGDLCDWKIRYKRAPMRTFTEMDSLTFSRVNRWKTAQLDWRGYAATDSINKLEKLKNRGAQAIIKVFTQMSENLMDDMRENFADEFWIDGNAAANVGRIHGFESALGYSGVQTNGFVGTPNSTYAGLLCTLGNYGGSWSTVSSNVNWPDGKGDPEYDFWSPLIVSYTNASWSATTKTWPNVCEEAIAYGINKGARAKSLKGQMDMILLDRELYRKLKDFQRAKERLNISRNEKQGLAALGFPDTINIDGVDVSDEYGIPTGVGYGMNMATCELKSMQETLFDADLPDFDITSQQDRFAIFFYGNLTFNPRYLTCWKAAG